MTCNPAPFFKLFSPRAVFESAKQLDSENSSPVSGCIHVGSSCFASCFELFRLSCFVCPLPIRGTLQNTFETPASEGES